MRASTRLLLFAALLYGLVSAAPVWAACSALLGQATINEVHRQGSAERFLEVKILNPAITSSTYDAWTIQVCATGGGCSGSISLADADDSTLPWIVVPKALISSQNYIDLRNGTDVLLEDGSGATIDYLSVDGYALQEDAGCPAPASFPYDSEVAGSNTQTVSREPDGTGDWSFAAGGSQPPTEGETNDFDPSLPNLDIANATASPGQTLSFTLTLDAAASGDVTVNFATQDDTALAGTHYVATSGTATILDGTLTTTVDVTLLSTPVASDLFFYLVLTNPSGANLTYHFAIATVTPTPSSTLDHYSISHDGSGVTCLGEAVTIDAVGSDGNDYLVTVDTVLTLTTDAATPLGSWSRVVTGSGTLSDSDPTDGTATYTWPGGESSVTLVFDYPVLVDGDSDTFTFDVTDDNATPVTETTGLALASDDPTMTFANTGFVFRNETDGTNVIPGQIAGKASDVNPNAVDIALWAVRTDTDTTACTGLFPDGGDVAVELGSLCDDPGSCQSGTQLTVTNNGSSQALANPENLDGGDAYSDVTLRFGTDSKATLVLDYPDAGAIQLQARYAIPLDDGSDSGEFVSGSSNVFVSRPFGFDIDFNLDTDGDGLFDDVLDDRASNGFAGASYAADADGSRYVMAGADFQAVVTAVAWASADDTDADGLPDTGADLTDNSVTTNFGQESSAAGVVLQHELDASMPADAIDGSLTGASISGFSAGQAQATLSWDEVGIIDLQARFDDSDGDGTDDYLGTAADLVNSPPVADPVAGDVAGVGRFYPARFVLKANVPSFANTCTSGANSFTYLGQGASDSSQGFIFSISPSVSVLPQKLGETDASAFTWNYRGAFWKLHADTTNPVTLYRTYTDLIDPTDPTYFLAYVDANADATLTLDADSTDGLTAPSIEPTGDRFAYARRSDPEAAFDADVDLALYPFESDDPTLNRNLIDSDGVCFDATAYDASGDVITNASASCNYDDAPGNESGLTLSNIGGATLRYGEPFTRGTYGTTAVIGDQLTLDLEARYYDGAAGEFTTHTDDACTTIQFCKTDVGLTTSLAQTDGTALTPDAGGIYGPITMGYDAALPGQADVVATLTADASTTGGRTTLTFAGCGTGWPAWLPNPEPATLVFGVFRGDDRILDWQESR